MDFNEVLSQKVVELVVVVVTGIIGILAQQATGYLRKLGQKIKNETDNQLVTSAYDTIEEVAEKVVLGLEQTIAKELRESVANGEKPKEALEDLAVEAKELILKICSNEIGQLEKQLIDAETYIESLIEAKVYEMKQKAAMFEPITL